MKKLLIALLAFPITAFSGQFDGIYATFGTGAYTSIHQNGNSFISISMSSIANNGVVGFTTGSSVVRPTSISVWSFGTGTLNSDGVSARFTSTNAVLGACITVTDVTFSGTTAVATLVSASNTALGNSSGINCSSLYQQANPSGSAAYSKIF